jgi:hypothetical protein
MNTVTIKITPDTEQKLRQQANEVRQSLEVYLERLAERAAANGTPTPPPVAPTAEHSRYISDPRPSQGEFDRLLRELAAGPPLPVLPADFTRDNIYDDHD